MNNFIFSSLVYYLSLQRCTFTDDVDRQQGNDFSIHGLWPDYIDGGYPQFCTNQKFNLSTIKPILDDLNKHWSSCSGKPDTFWKHEFEKHGTCFDPPTTEFDYFNNTLTTFHKLKNDGTIDKLCQYKFNCMIELPNYNVYTS
jgi:ribonuclease I